MISYFDIRTLFPFYKHKPSTLSTALRFTIQGGLMTYEAIITQYFSHPLFPKPALQGILSEWAVSAGAFHVEEIMHINLA